MSRSIISSKTSNIIETETPKYRERDPPIEDTKDPVNCIKRKEDWNLLIRLESELSNSTKQLFKSSKYLPCTLDLRQFSLYSEIENILQISRSSH